MFARTSQSELEKGIVMFPGQNWLRRHKSGRSILLSAAVVVLLGLLATVAAFSSGTPAKLPVQAVGSTQTAQYAAKAPAAFVATWASQQIRGLLVVSPDGKIYLAYRVLEPRNCPLPLSKKSGADVQCEVIMHLRAVAVSHTRITARVTTSCATLTTQPRRAGLLNGREVTITTHGTNALTVSLSGIRYRDVTSTNFHRITSPGALSPAC